MAIFVLTNAKLYVAEYDMSSDFNQLTLRTGAEEKEVTTFGASYKTRVAGHKVFSLEGAGYTNIGAGEPDPVFVDNLGVADKLVTVAADGGDAGEVAYFTKTTQGSLQLGGDAGEVHAFNIACWGRGVETVRGTVAHDTGTARTSTGNGTAYEIGAASASQKLYAGLHVTAASGTSPSLTVKVQSDDNSGFTSATDRITFTAATAVTSEWATPVAGAITDTYWRVTWTISGTNPSFNFICTVGIQ